MIKPTIGRKLWYWATLSRYHEAQKYTEQHDCPVQDQPEDATIAAVWDPKLVNLVVTDHNGIVRSETSVILLQEGDPLPNSRFATWMPFQVGQARAQAATTS